jgi:RHS repeat-associated protein
MASMLWSNSEKPTQVLTVPLGPDRRVNLFSSQAATFTVRVLGWYTSPLVIPVNYVYDKNGNRVTETDTATSVVTSYAWDPLDRLTSVTKGLAGGGTAQTLFTDTPATVNTSNWHAWWPPAATPYAGGGVTFNTNGERNAISGLSLTAGNYEIEFVGPDNGAVSVAPYVQGHQNWTNYVEPLEKIGAQGQLAAKPWTGIKKWAMTIPAGPNGLASTHLDVRIVGTGSFTVTSMILRRVAPPATVNVYDADGQRLVRKDPSGQLTVFLDGQEIVLNTGSPTVVSAARYYSGSTLLAQRSSTGGLTYMGTDHQGTVTATLSTGGVVSRQRYKPYGAQRGSSNVLPSERGFIGQIEDTSTGLSYLNARHYDTVTATFLSVDPLMQPGKPMVAQYGYGDASPVGNSDPTGMIVAVDDGGYDGGCTGSGCNGGPDPVTSSPGYVDGYNTVWKLFKQHPDWQSGGFSAAQYVVGTSDVYADRDDLTDVLKAYLFGLLDAWSDLRRVYPNIPDGAGLVAEADRRGNEITAAEAISVLITGKGSCSIHHICANKNNIPSKSEDRGHRDFGKYSKRRGLIWTMQSTKSRYRIMQAVHTRRGTMKPFLVASAPLSRERAVRLIIQRYRRSFGQSRVSFERQVRN